MFSRLNVRTKLLVMTVPAVLGVCGLTGVGVHGRLEARTTAVHDRDAVALAGKATAFVAELQQERLAAVMGEVAPSADSRRALAEQVARTTDAANELVVRVTADAATELFDGTASRSAALNALREGPARLDALRRSRSSSDVTTIEAGYSSVIGDLIGAVGTLDGSTAGGRTGAAARRWLAIGTEAEAAATAIEAELLDADLDAAAQAAVARRTERLAARSKLAFDVFGSTASSTERTRFADARDTDEFRTADRYVTELRTGDATAFTGRAATYGVAVSGRLAQLRDVAIGGYLADIATLGASADRAGSAALTFSIAALLGCLAVAVLAFVVSRSITSTLGRLTDAARDISRDQVPALVESLRATGGSARVHRFVEVDVDSADEFADVAGALNDLGRTMFEVAAEQHQSLRTGISEIFVNLARRNQALLDRQIQFIDLLEANEQDPDQLDHLFRLDHLATRMRRNAESLLVLAGAEAPRRRSRDVAIGDVLRVAIGEVEDYARVSLVAVEPVNAIGGAAVDLAHLLAELMENGAQYSSPEHTVDVVGHDGIDGSYIVSISDHGVGMTIDRIEAANRLLADPPPLGLALSRSLGFVVAGTLANRHGITVTLSPSPSGGLTAEVTIPAALVVAPVPEPLPAPSAPVAPAVPVVVDPPPVGPPVSFTALDVPVALDVPAALDIQPVSGMPPAPPTPAYGWTIDGEYVAPPVGVPAMQLPPPYVPPTPAVESLEPTPDIVWAPDRLPTAKAPSKLADVLPEGDAFEAGIYGLLDRPVPGAPEFAPGEFAPGEFAPGEVAPGEFAPGEGPSSASPPPFLPQRDRGAVPAAPIDEVEHRTTAPVRPADDVRNLLSRYRDGLHSGRAEAADHSAGQAADQYGTSPQPPSAAPGAGEPGGTPS
ncbi:MAG: hypothetical protein U0Q22_07865 [Acidimicrobiales bacterium]